MISPLASIFTSHSKAQEILFLLHDLKEVVRQGYYEHELPAVEQFCKENNLFIVKSKFKVLLTDENQFTNKGERVAPDHPQGMYFVYISNDETKAYLASYYELINNHRELGLLLGYPECCIEFFCRNFDARNTDLQSPSTNIYTDLTQRDKDKVLISHFPCSSDCAESIALGKKYLELLKGVDVERAVDLERGLGRKD